jgi:hypothetical protein
LLSAKAEIWGILNIDIKVKAALFRIVIISAGTGCLSRASGEESLYPKEDQNHGLPEGKLW